MPTSARSGRRVTTVALVGFMGAGKTTIGQGLAERLGWRFLDLDRLIEERDERSVERIFLESGESAFRILEHKLLREFLNAPNTAPSVLALGGGAFVQPEIRKLLRDANVASIFLDATADELFHRSEQPGVIRPLRRDPKQFADLYEQRREFYSQAELHVHTVSKNVASVIEEIIVRLVLVPYSGVNE